MLSIGLFSIVVAIPFFSYRITPSLFNRITSVVLIYSALLSFNGIYVESLASGVGIYSGLFHITTVSLGVESFILFISAIILLGWESNNKNNFIISEYSLIILFTSIGSTLLISSSDIVSIYLSIELQSFGIYILSTLYRNSESATSAGLKYFLLGGLSSAIILLGTAIIYSNTGLTQFENIYTLIQVVGVSNFNKGVISGILLICFGYLFKISSAPLHHWAPDVYDGVPTIVTSWLTTIPKIPIFIFLLELQSGFSGSFESFSLILGNSSITITINMWKNLLLIASLLSLIIGTVVGLSQYRIKRLFAYSTISHVGFILLALAINTEKSIESFLFYLIQYSITNLNLFIILLAFGYCIQINIKNISSSNNKKNRKMNFNRDIEFIVELKGQFKENPLLGISIIISLFSIAGIPPLIGFFAKQIVLYSSIHSGYYFISIIAIIVSVISAIYYLKIIKIIYFSVNNITKIRNSFESILPISTESTQSTLCTENTESRKSTLYLYTKNTESIKSTHSIKNTESKKSIEIVGITNIHSIIIACLTIIIILFILQPSILLNSCYLIALSLFYF